MLLLLWKWDDLLLLGQEVSSKLLVQVCPCWVMVSPSVCHSWMMMKTCLVFDYSIALARLFNVYSFTCTLKCCSGFKMTAESGMWVLYIRCQITWGKVAEESPFLSSWSLFWRRKKSVTWYSRQSLQSKLMVSEMRQGIFLRNSAFFFFGL